MPYGTSSSRKRHDHARRQSSNNEGWPATDGVDGPTSSIVSRDWLDGFCVLSGRRLRLPNTAVGHAQLLTQLQDLSQPVRVGFEATGGQEWVLWSTLVAAGVEAVQLPPAQIKAFALSRGSWSSSPSPEGWLQSQTPSSKQASPGNPSPTGEHSCYDTRRCHSAVIARGGTAIIPIRRNGRAWKVDCPAAKAHNETLRATRYCGRAFWKRWTGYHARSRVEAKMRFLKAFGERIAARDPDRQTAEIQIRVAIINRFHALGTAEVVRVD